MGAEGAVLAQGSAVLVEPEPLPSTSGSSGGSAAKAVSSGSLMEQLAARGIVVTQKEVEKDMGQMGESQDDEESTDDDGEEESGEEEDLEEEEERDEGDEGEEEEEDYDEEALLIPG